MKLLIITQKVDEVDDLLGFMHGWIEEFSRQCEKVTVIALGAGAYNLPANVKVLSLGKEETNFRFRGTVAECHIRPKFSNFGKFLSKISSPISLYCLKNFIKNFLEIVKIYARKSIRRQSLRKIKYLLRFYKYIWHERKNYDAVFVHMNHEYVILGGLIWKTLNKKIGLWYAHGYAPPSLRLAEKLADYIFTSTKSGFRLKSKKTHVVGQGINIDKFKFQISKSKAEDGMFEIISVGRISPVKDYETLIKALEILKNKGIKLKAEIIGGPAALADKNYFSGLLELVKNKDLTEVMEFIGPIANKEILKFLRGADLFVNMSRTGSLDKAILEAMASGLPILTCNESLKEVLGGYKNMLIYDKGDFQALAEKIEFIKDLPPDKIEKISQGLRRLVAANHGLSSLAEKILFIYGQKN